MVNRTAAVGACMADLVAGVHALVTERECGMLLDQRERELLAMIGAIRRHVTAIAAARRGIDDDVAETSAEEG